MQENLLDGLEPLPLDTSVHDTSLNSNIKPESIDLANTIQSDVKFNLNNLRNTQGAANEAPKSFIDTFLTPTSLDLGGFDADPDLVTTELNSGDRLAKFDTFEFGVNNEEILAQQQTGWEQAINGVTKFGQKVAFNFLDATAGTVVGLAEGIKDGSLESVFNNNFSQYIDDLNTKVDNKLPNHYTEEQKNMGFLKSTLTTNFWANDVLGGASFLLGTVASEAAWAYATGGTSLFTALPRVAAKAAGKGLIKAGAKSAGKNLYKNTLKLTKAYQRSIPASKFGEVLSNARYMYTSAAYESGVEARHSLNESLENFILSYEQSNGQEPSQAEKEAFLIDATDASNKVFAANLGLVGASNIAQFGTYFGLGTGLSKKASTSVGKIFGAGLTSGVENGKLVYKALKPAKAQKFLGNTLSFLQAPLTEGVIEEGGQGVISGTAQEWLASRYNPKALSSNLSVIEAATNSLEETFGTAQGRKEIGIGMIIGALGDRGGRAVSKQGVLSTDFSDRIRSFSAQADNLNTASDKLTQVQRDTLDRLVKTNQFNTYVNKAERSSEKGDFTQASLSFDTAQFTKHLIEDNAGMLEDSVADFETIIRNTPDENISAEYNLSKQQVADYKDSLITNYKENYQLYKKAKDISESLGFGNFNIEGAKKDYTEELGLNIYLGVKSAQRASDLSDTISEFVGDTGMASALITQSNISESAVRIAKTVVKLETELENLQNELAGLQTSFTSTNLDATERQRENVSVAKNIDKKEVKRQKLVERLAKRRVELADVRSQLNNTFFENRGAFQGNFNVFNQTSEFITDQEVVESVTKIEQLEDYLTLLKKRNPNAASTLESLMSDYIKSVQQFKNFNTTFEQITSDKFDKNSYTGVLKAFNDNSRAKDLNLDDVSEGLQKVLEANPDLSQSEIFTLKVLESLQSSFNNRNEDVEIGTNNINQDTVVDTDSYNIFIEKGEVSEEVLTAIANKLKNNPSNPNLGERELAIFSEKSKEVKIILDALNLQEGDSLEDLGVEINIEELEENSLSNKLKNLINKIKKNKNFLQSFDVDEIVESDKPTNKDYSGFDELLQKEQDNTLTPAEIAEFTSLKDKINRWGALEGTLTESKTSLADLIEQLFLLEQNNPLNKDNANSIKIEDIIGGEGFISDRTSEHYDNLQNPDSVTFFRDKTHYNISNMSVDLFLDIVTKSPNITVTQKSKTKTSKNGKWNVKSNQGDSFTVNFGTEKVVVGVGERKRLRVSPKGVRVLNRLSNLVLDRTNTLPTNFQVVLQKVGLEEGKTELVPVQSDSTYANGMRVDTEAIYNLKNGDEMFLEVNTNDDFNRNLLERYNNASEAGKAEVRQQMEKSLSIYAKDKNNNFLGVHKDRSFNRLQKDKNADALDKIRKIAVQKVLENTVVIGDTVDIGVTVPVSTVYIGHPNLNISEINGELRFDNLDITDRVLNQIQDVGYMLNGKLTLKEDTKEVEVYPFGDKVSKNPKYRDVKVPVVVLKFKGRKILYPVS